MPISWFSISISLQSGVLPIFKGYFSVDDTANLVTSFYKTINGSTDFNNDILYPPNIYGDKRNDNKFPITYQGIGLTIPILYGHVSYDKIIVFYSANYSGPQHMLVNSSTYEYLNINTRIFPIPNPIFNICFPVGTPITCNQGNIPIEKINPDIHTIRNKKIVGITKTITQDKYLVCFEKDALGTNIPSQKTIISKNHSIFYEGNMRKAKEFVGINDKIYKIKYRKELLYNVLMKEHDKMLVNNLICETLHPENGMARLYRDLQKLNPEQQHKIINKYNEYVIKDKN
jgi:hypothetical protein